MAWVIALHWKNPTKFTPRLGFLFQSLKVRFLLASAILLPFFISIVIYVIVDAFEDTLLSAQETELASHSYSIIGMADVIDGKIKFPDLSSQPALNTMHSGLSAIVLDRQGQILWRSRSTELKIESYLDFIKDNEPQPGTYFFEHLKDSNLFVFVNAFVWEVDGVDHFYCVVIFQNDELAMMKLVNFEAKVWQWLFIFYILALLIQFAVLKWALRPLNRLAQDLVHIEKGESEKLTGEYPSEVKRITQNLNQLLESEKEQRVRYKNTLGDLAHSLKTPLAVIKGANAESLVFDEYRVLVDEQSTRMMQIVNYQLGRAVKSQGNQLRQHVSVKTSVNRILKMLQRVYSEKQVNVISFNLNQQFVGDERDFMEMAGNLIENAFKYSDRQVRITTLLLKKEFELIIENDGRSISKEQEQTVLERGARLDTSRPGQGIGLSVVADIVSSYNGGLAMSQSSLGGAKIVLRLPSP